MPACTRGQRPGRAGSAHGVPGTQASGARHAQGVREARWQGSCGRAPPGATGKPARPPVTGERQGVTAGPGALGEQVGEPSAMWQYSAAECGPPSPLKTPSPWRPGPQPTTPLATAWQKLWRQTLEPVPWCGTCLWAAGHAAHGCAGHLALSASSLLRAGSMCPARSGAALGPEDCWLAVSPEPGSRPPGRHVGHKRRTAPCPAEGPGSLRGQDTPGQREKHQVRVEEGDPALAWPGRQLPSPPPHLRDHPSPLLCAGHPSAGATQPEVLNQRCALRPPCAPAWRVGAGPARACGPVGAPLSARRWGQTACWHTVGAQ